MGWRMKVWNNFCARGLTSLTCFTDIQLNCKPNLELLRFWLYFVLLQCEAEFSVETLSKVLPAKTMSLCLRKMQEEAIRLADIQDLVSCPFCAFSTIMPNPEDKLFRCLNPECLKESCRLSTESTNLLKASIFYEIITQCEQTGASSIGVKY